MQQVVMTDDQWVDEFEPHEAFYETYGHEFEQVKNTPIKFVWTMLDEGIIVNGMSFVNRIGYYITKKPHNPDDIIVVEWS